MNRTVLASATILALAVALAMAPGGCAGGTRGPATPATPATHPPGGADPAAAESSVISADILAREPLANTATVKHILISWRDLADNFEGHLDERASKRSKADAETEVRALVKQLQGGADFDALMKANSEDTSSANGRTFTVTPDARLVIEFRQLSLRLKTGEIGVCQSDFGFHIIKRVS